MGTLFNGLIAMLQAIGGLLADIADLLNNCVDVYALCTNVTWLVDAIDEMIGGFAYLLGAIMG